MQIQGPSQLHGAQPISTPHAPRTAAPANAAQPTATGDEVNISSAGEIAARMSEIPDIRQERVDAIRAAIASGTYETEEKLSAAADRLLDEIG